MTPCVDINSKAALSFADAILNVWGEDIDISAHVMAGQRDMAAKQGLEPYAAAFQLDRDIEEARRGSDTAKTEEAKLQMVRAILYIWPRVQRHLQDKIFKAVRDLAIVRGDNPDLALAEVMPVIERARHGDELLAEKQTVLVAARAKQQAKRDRDHRAQVRKRFESRALQGM